MDDWLLLASGPTQRLSIFDPASPQAASIRNLSYLVFAVSAFIFVVVEGVLFYSILRFRRRRPASLLPPGVPVPAGGQPSVEPPQVYGSMPIEIAWTAAPALVVFGLVLVTTRTLWEVNPPLPQPQAGDNALFVTVVGRQWWWELSYDHYDGRPLGFITANELHVPASEDGRPRPVHLKLESADVCHSFWVPRLAGKTDLIPGRTNYLSFQTDQTGLFLGQCAEYCGTQHANMLLRVVVQTPNEFARWRKNQQSSAVEDGAVRRGKDAFFAQSCVNCHRIRGTNADGTYAPDLTHLMSRETLAGGMIPNTIDNLQRWVDDPQQIKQGCLMPAFGLSEGDRDEIVRYLLTLR